MNNTQFEELKKAVNDLDRINNIFKTDEGDGLITYEDLKSYAFDIVHDLGNGVSFSRVFHPEKEVYFITNMNPLKGVLVNGTLTALFGKQWHDCKEIVDVIEGHLIETFPLEENNTITLKGRQKIYKKLEIHKPSANIVSKYGVEFIEPKQ